jgi:UDP-N-acetylglucosamine 2-epimerase (non-hydrolysing)
LSKRKICVVTGSRAEYGLLFWLLKEILIDPKLELQIVATGMHLSPEFGSTYKAIEADGFAIDAKVEMLLSSDTAVGVAKSIGLGVIGFADAFERLAPDMLVVLGDRFEILAAVQAALVLRIPIAHLAGGDNSGSGTYDNIIRHCVSKMAALHFVTHEDARRRVVQLGELPERVFCFGASCVENVVKLPLLSRVDLEQALKLKFKDVVVAVTFHPLTTTAVSNIDQLRTLLDALDALRNRRDCTVIITKPNSDNGSRALIEELERYVGHRPDCHLFDSLGQLRYLSVLQQADFVIGNSSSGIYEAPYLRTPTVDIGDRQRGRAVPASVIHCEAEAAAIAAAMESALTVDFDTVEMIYGNGNVSPRIVEKIKEYVFDANVGMKVFYDLPAVMPEC